MGAVAALRHHAASPCRPPSNPPFPFLPSFAPRPICVRPLLFPTHFHIAKAFCPPTLVHSPDLCLPAGLTQRLRCRPRACLHGPQPAQPPALLICRPQPGCFQRLPRPCPPGGNQRSFHATRLLSYLPTCVCAPAVPTAAAQIHPIPAHAGARQPPARPAWRPHALSDSALCACVFWKDLYPAFLARYVRQLVVAAVQITNECKHPPAPTAFKANPRAAVSSRKATGIAAVCTQGETPGLLLRGGRRLALLLLTYFAQGVNSKVQVHWCLGPDSAAAEPPALGSTVFMPMRPRSVYSMQPLSATTPTCKPAGWKRGCGQFKAS